MKYKKNQTEQLIDSLVYFILDKKNDKHFNGFKILKSKRSIKIITLKNKK